MQIKKLIKLLEVIEDKLPYDMHILSEYIYDGDKTKAPIGDMDFVHFVRAFVKMNSYDSDLDKSVSKINHEEDIKQNYVRKDVYEMLFDKCEKLERTIDALIRENRVKLQENYELRHPRYVFSEIPNDCDGQRFIDDVKKYFNKGTYRMRVRGQHVKEEYKGTGVTAYGQNIEQSTHLRVYIEEKD
tara:strand:- start:726 stop:1283 length:558 start_codon:yes stop_codon:yes gene_type:complete